MSFPTMITINGTLKKIDGTAEKGHIVFQAPISAMSSTDSTVVVPSYKVVTLDIDGSFSVSLPASNDPSWNPSNWTYRVIEQISSGTREYRTIVPYDAVGGQFDYPELVPAIDVDAQLYALYNHTHPGGGGSTVDWADIVNKPTTFPPATHNHDDRYYTEAEITALFAAIVYPVTSVAGKTGAVTLVKTDVGLSNVDNTSDTNKPVSSATQTALDLKAPLASPTFTGTVSGITKSMVGLGNVDNTADSAKPVSTAQQTALDLKVDTADYPGLLVLNTGDPIPGGTASGTVIVRV